MSSKASTSTHENMSNAPPEPSTSIERKIPANKRVLRKRLPKKKAFNEEFDAKKERKKRGSAKSTVDSWKLVEKKYLLEGLKNYGPQKIKYIANLIETKSEAEVQEKIFSLRGAAACDTQTADGVNMEERAPIEKWIHNISELVNCDDTDCSQEIAKTLGYIAKHETFTENQAPELSWQNIYIYLGALAENRTEGLPTLSDIESMILLELMTDLGTTLNKLNTTPQRQILEHKIQLINAGMKVQYNCKAQRVKCASLVAKALGNDFTGLEHLLIDAKSGSSSSATPSNSSSTPETVSEIVGSTEKDQSTSKSNVNYSVNPSNLVSKDDAHSSEHVLLKHGETLEKTFVKPKLFTFNPLCIPTKLLKFQPKDV